MNRAKKSHNKEIAKKLKKEVRNTPVLSKKAVAEATALATLERAKQFPHKKEQKKKTNIMPAIERVMTKKSKPKAGISKRTSAAAVAPGTDTTHVQPEGKRWVKTLRKQEAEHTRVLRTQMNKRGVKI